MKHLNFLNKMFITLLFFLFCIIANSQTAMFEEDFEGTLAVTPGGVPSWSINTTLQVSGTNSYQNAVALNDSSWFVTEEIDLTGYNFVILEFEHICKIEFFDAAEIFISVNGGTSWTKLTQNEYLGVAQFGTNGNKFTATSYPLLWLPSQHSEPPTNAWWMNEQFDVSALAGNQSQVMFKFKLSDGNANGANANAGWFLDDIKVMAAIDELIPPVITMVPPVLQDTAFNTGPYEILAEITDASGIAEAKLVYNINGLNQDTLDMVIVSGDTYMATIPSFTYNNTINYYVYAVDSSTMANYAQSATYSFFIKQVLGSGQNIALTATSAQSGGGSSSTGYGPENYNDDIIPPYNCSPTPCGWGWVSTNGWIEYTWTNPEAFNRIVFFKDNRPMSTCAIQIWDGSAYTTILNYNNTAIEDTVDFPTPYTTTKLRFNSIAGSNNPNFREIQVFAPQQSVPFSFDAGVSQLIDPATTIYTTAPTPVNIRIKNFSPDTLHKVTVEWSVNGAPQTPYSWTGTLLEDQVSSILNIGSFAFPVGQHQLKVWTSMPNDSVDQNTVNDTLTRSILVCDGMLSGTYTVGQGGDYLTVQDAMNALSLCGINGPVVFQLAADTFNTRMVFNGVLPGTSPVNTVTFRGTAGTVIQYSTSVTGERAAVLLDGAKYLRFDSLNIYIPDASGFGHGFHLINQAEDIQITNCEIYVHSSSTSTNYSGIVASGSLTSATTTGNSAHNILIENNKVYGGYYGIIFYGASATPLNEIVIRNNEVLETYYYSIRAQYTNSMVIDGNLMDARITGGTTSHYGLYVGYTYEPVELINNTIVNAGLYGMYLTNVNSPVGRTLIGNNSIGGGFRSTGSPYGIYLTSSSNIDIVHNSINVDAGTGRGIYSLSSAVGLAILNNSFVYSGTSTGYAVYHASTASIIEHDHNNYYSTGSNFVFYGSNVPDLTVLQAINNPPGNDQNSVSGDPIYISNTYLLPLSGVLDQAGTHFPAITTDILGNPRDPSSPDIGAYEYTPAAGDIALLEAKLVNGLCLSSNDSLYVKIKNIIGSAVDFSSDPLTIHWNINGPVVTSDFLVWDSGLLNLNDELIIGVDGIDLSMPGIYTLSVYIETNAVNTLPVNDTLNTAHELTIEGYVFDAEPDNVLITTPVETVELTVNSNLLPTLGSFYITEICTYRGSTTGAPSGGWPSYLIADDYIEVTGVPGLDLGGNTLEIWTTTALSGSQILQPGTVIGPSGTCVIAVGQLGSSAPSPANYYYHSGHTATLSSTINYGFIFKDPNGDIIDAVAYGNYDFPVAAGVTPADWTGYVPNQSSAGTRLVGPYTKDATNWINSAISPQDPNSLNPGVTVPSPVGIQNFSWSLDGVITSVNSVDTIVGPWLANGLYQYVATYITPCGTFTDTVHITVGIPAFDLKVTEIIKPEDNICTDGISEDVIIKITNLGIDTLFGGFTASYSIDHVTTITENVSATIAPADTITYTFNTPITIVTSSVDSTFYLNTWVYYSGDPYQQNDTLGMDVTFNFYPELPVVQGDTVNYGQQATLVASSNGTIYWFADTLSPSHFHIGDTLITQPLFSNTTYWVEAAGASVPADVQLGTGTLTTSATGITPFTSFYEGARIQYLIQASELIALGMNTGNINSLGFDVTVSGPGTYPQLDYTIKMVHTSNTELTGNYGTPSGNWTTVYYNASEPAPSVGWKMFTFSTPFFWDGISNILIDICHENDPNNTCSGCYSTSSTVRYTATTFNSVYGRYNDNAPACNVNPTSVVTTGLTNRPNIRLMSNPVSCPTPRIPVTAVVNLPAIEPEIVFIVEPLDEECSINANIVSIEITNNGSDTIVSGLTASYQIETGTPVTENVTDPVAPGDTVLFTFATPFALNLTTGDSTILVTAWVNHPTDWYNVNDTTTKTSTLGFTPPSPLADNDTIPFGGQATLEAISSYNVTWYDAPVGGNELDTGLIYQTPVLYANTPYYVGANESSSVSEQMGMLNAASTSSFITTTIGWGLFFTVVEEIVIDTVHVYPTGTGTITIQILDSLTNTVLFTGPTVNLTGDGTNGPANKKAVPVDLLIPPGGYKMSMTYSGITNLIRESSGAAHPYIAPSGFARITAGATGGASPSTATYYWFYDWKISTPGQGCESPRTEVWAIIDSTTIPLVDAGVYSIDGPSSPATLQPNPVEVSIRSYGTDPLTSATIAWTVNGVPQTPYSWTGNLTQGGIETGVVIGTATFSLGNNEIVAWTENPNGVSDVINVNDTAYYTLEAYEPLCGTYTIGGSNPDFTDFTQAIYGMTNWGITCPVVFNVAPGTYYEQLRIGEITGAGSTNTITFTGTGNPVLSYGPSVNTERHVLIMLTAPNTCDLRI
jgi:hypothetical protein